MEENNMPAAESVSQVAIEKKANDFKILSAILGVIVLGLLIYMFYGRFTGGGITGNVISDKDATQKLVDYLNAKTGGGVTFVSSDNFGSNLYEITVSYNGQNIPVYITKDGLYFVQGAVPLAGDNTADGSTPDVTATPQDIPKSDKPKVELFVMTHCPYGTQAEKGLIPAIKALGSKADVKIRFVHYFMHGDKEEKETYNQVCIREEQSSKYFDYLSCFLEDGNSERCLTKTGIDKTKLNACLADDNKKAKEYYKADSDLSNKYGVQGSPTLIINGVEADSARDSVSYLKTVCSSFNKAPTAECSKQLSSASPAPGFGTATAPAGSAGSNAAGCATA